MSEDLAFRTPCDGIDALISALNAATGGGLTFERDVLDTDRPEDWGAVELTGIDYEYADGKVIDRLLKMDVWASVSDRGSDWLTLIEGVMAAQGVSFKLKERAYLHDLRKVLWRWEATLWSAPADPAEREAPPWPE